MFTVAEIAGKLNRLAPSLAPKLLPNGKESGNYWLASGIRDTGRSESLVVKLAGEDMGHWQDYGNCAAGEERGDMLDLLRLTRRLSAADAVQEAKAILGISDRFVPHGNVRPNREEMERRAEEARRRAEERQARIDARRVAKAKRAKALYLSARPIAGTPAEAYLVWRGFSKDPFPDWPGALRFHPEAWHDFERRKMPAMVAAIYNAAGEQTGVHRTFLTRDPRDNWIKISGDGLKAKLVWGGMRGSFIPISKGRSGKPMRAMPLEPVYVTEGIENAIVVRMMKPDARIVAAVNLGNIGEIVLPPVPPGEKRQLVIVADRDTSPKAQATLERAVARQQGRGVEVFIVFPPTGINDLSDWLEAIKRGRLSA